MAVRFPPSFKIKQSNNLLFIFQSHARFISVIVILGYTSLQLKQKIRPASFLIFILFIYLFLIKTLQSIFQAFSPLYSLPPAIMTNN